MDLRCRSVTAKRIKDGVIETFEDTIVSETPLTIYFNEEELVTLLCTWEHIDELAVGFLRSEGFIKIKDDIEEIKIDEKRGEAKVRGRAATIARHTFLKRYITTGCGKGTSFYNLSDAVAKPITTDFSISSARILSLMHEAQRRSELFKITGGVHSSALCDDKGILFFREDIGRHNTVDKLIGRCILSGIDTRGKMLITTGRISSEILVKTAKMGIPLIASRSAPTELAVRHANELGVTIAAFVRNDRMNIYSHHERVEP